MQFGNGSILAKICIKETIFSLYLCISKLPCQTPNNANLNLQHTYWDKPKDVIRNSNYTHSQRRTCTPCWEHVGRFINKLLNTTLTQNAFCKIEATGHCDLKSKQSWDNRLTDPKDRLHLWSSQLSNHFIPLFPAGPCRRETIRP